MPQGLGEPVIEHSAPAAKLHTGAQQAVDRRQHVMSDEAHREGGQRIATQGYAGS